MNNCWKTVNISREIGQGRIYIMSSFMALLAFILLFLPYSIYHHNVLIKDHGLLPLIITLLTLPLVHKLTHVIPLILCYRRIKVHLHLTMGFIPTLTCKLRSFLSKKTTMFMWLGPTLFLTIPGIVAAIVLPSYYPYILLYTAINIGLSFKDFVYIKQIVNAPKKCLIEEAKDGYDILIKNSTH
ncbi:DUF3267 domain-containing protein [Salinibacillus xinjiangensis]|uniref:DUF3267 domain-containing protein n=1 Tax=Salinibacillus xinjiangensis TaxID=1229268 RepID=A0A6G1X7R8_9BACI|nr:DUF3267 domain-containing protein [Salinibacillus xinjiangensis]MRG86920.1 DUF3267 domain-containing protein [Salinibacillus xinjiangensis]